MGIRPHLDLIFGIDDLQVDEKRESIIIDPRLKNRDVFDSDNIWEYRIPLPKKPDMSKSEFWTEPQWEEAIGLPMLEELKDGNYTGQAKELYEILYWHFEYGNPKIMGLKLGKSLYNEEALWGLSCCDEKFSVDGYMIARNYPSTESISLYPLILACEEMIRANGKLNYSKIKTVLRKHKEIRKIMKLRRNRWLYPHWDWVSIEMWAHSAMYLFRAVGFQIAEKDLKLMLVWRWG